jgi:hypothetical protein
MTAQYNRFWCPCNCGCKCLDPNCNQKTSFPITVSGVVDPGPADPACVNCSNANGSYSVPNRSDACLNEGTRVCTWVNWASIERYFCYGLQTKIFLEFIYDMVEFYRQCNVWFDNSSMMFTYTEYEVYQPFFCSGQTLQLTWNDELAPDCNVGNAICTVQL